MYKIYTENTSSLTREEVFFALFSIHYLTLWQKVCLIQSNYRVLFLWEKRQTHSRLVRIRYVDLIWFDIASAAFSGTPEAIASTSA